VWFSRVVLSPCFFFFFKRERENRINDLIKGANDKLNSRGYYWSLGPDSLVAPPGYIAQGFDAIPFLILKTTNPAQMGQQGAPASQAMQMVMQQQLEQMQQMQEQMAAMQAAQGGQGKQGGASVTPITVATAYPTPSSKISMDG
jgi:hypothetical protein